MKITIQRTESKEIEIITPAYYRISEHEVIAIFDEKNVVGAYDNGGLIITSSREFWALCEKDKLKDENLIDESEFFECYNKAHAALSLLPKYSESDEIENGSQEDWTEKMNDHAETEILNFDK